MYSNSSNRLLLAIDTSSDCCSVALVGKGIDESRSIVVPRKHTQYILPLIDEVLKAGNVELLDLDAIAFGHGPGSFTGIRLAASVAQGLAFPHNLPTIGISTLRAMAQEIFEINGFTQVIIVQDARMGEIYLGKYLAKNGTMRPVFPDRLAKSGYEVEKIITADFALGGNGVNLYLGISADNFKKTNVFYPGAWFIAKLALSDITSGLKFTNMKKALPVYLRNEVVRLQ